MSGLVPFQECHMSGIAMGSVLTELIPSWIYFSSSFLTIFFLLSVADSPSTYPILFFLTAGYTQRINVNHYLAPAYSCRVASKATHLLLFVLRFTDSELDKSRYMGPDSSIHRSFNFFFCKTCNELTAFFTA